MHGKRAGKPVVLKVVKEQGDEWRCGEIAAKFGGRGVVQVYEHMAGAALFEKLDPGEPLAALTLAGRDDEATDILAMMLGRMAPGDPPEGCPTVEQWGEGFMRYLGERRRAHSARAARARAPHFPRSLPDATGTRAAARRPASLQRAVGPRARLVRDRCEGRRRRARVRARRRAAQSRSIGPISFASLDVVERRLDHFGLALGIDTSRARGWCFAQAVLAAIWSIEDGGRRAERDAALALARALLDSSALRADFLD